MATTFQEMLARAQILALAGSDPHEAPVLDGDMILETLYPIIARRAARDAAGSPSARSLLRRTKSISMTNGNGILPDDVMTYCLDEASVVDTNDPDVGPKMSWVREWYDFTRSKDTRLGYFTAKQDRTFFWIEPGSVYDASAGITGTIEINVPCAPPIPATASAPVDASPEIIDEMIFMLARALRGGAGGQGSGNASGEEGAGK